MPLGHAASHPTSVTTRTLGLEACRGRGGAARMHRNRLTPTPGVGLTHRPGGPGPRSSSGHRGGKMRNRAFGLSILFVFSLDVTACGGSSADIKKVGLVTDVGTLEDKSFNEASWVGTQAGAKALGGTASNIVTNATTEYAANIKTFVDQGYGIIVTVGFAMGDATTVAAKQYPKVKFIGVDQGVCIDETGKGDPTFACKGDPKTLLPNYQGLVFKEEQVGYLAGVLAAGVSKTGV